MTDRELLKLAAMASGELNEHWVGNEAYFDGVLSRWNPLANDGDALRLAVTLAMNLRLAGENTVNIVCECYDVEILQKANPDKNEATRRAIVKAAAKIQKAREGV